jgi:RimJ/RimL family protein N-acetyltransferase
MKTDHNFLQGKHIYLREVRCSDVNETYCRWMNDPEITQYLESRFAPNSMENLQEYVKNFQGDRDNIFLAIVLKQNQKHIGNIKIGPINWYHRLADIGIMIGDKDCWGKGYAPEAISLLAYFAFNTLNLHKLTAGCYEQNQGSLKAFQKAGFEIEGVRKKHCFSNGNYVDEILLGKINHTEKDDEKEIK